MKNAYLVYYGPPILRSNPKLRTRTTFVGVLLYEKEDWSLCISSYLGNVNEISEAWNIAKHKFEVMKSNESLSTTSSLGPGFAKAKKIYDTIGNFDTNNIVCEIISELCVLTDDQFENLSKFINSNSGKYRTTWLRDEAPRWPFFINWIITFKKGVLSCWIDGTTLTRKEIKIIENITPGKQPKFVIDNTANKERVPREDEITTTLSTTTPSPTEPLVSTQIAAATVHPHSEFLLVTYPQRTEGTTDFRYDFLKKEAQKTFFDDADRAPETAEEEYTRFLQNDATRSLGGDKHPWKEVNKYLKEISEPGQDFTHERPL